MCRLRPYPHASSRSPRHRQVAVCSPHVAAVPATDGTDRDQLLAELQRLRRHLVELDTATTAELLRAEEREGCLARQVDQLRTQLAQCEQQIQRLEQQLRTDASTHARQQEVEEAHRQRDDALRKASRASERLDQSRKGKCPVLPASRSARTSWPRRLGGQEAGAGAAAAGGEAADGGAGQAAEVAGAAVRRDDRCPAVGRSSGGPDQRQGRAHPQAGGGGYDSLLTRCPPMPLATRLRAPILPSS